MKIGTREFDCYHKTYVAGILNTTPDSFFDGGKWNCMDAALRHAEQMIADGADLIDIGGESTRPGYVEVDETEEIYRTAPIIEQIKARFDIPVSIDTYKSGVARAAIAAGADLLNDIWGLRYDAAMAGVIADAGVACCLMHNRKKAEYQELLPDIQSDLRKTLSIAKAAGIADDRIILDPGVGFGKTYEDNLVVLRSLGQIRALGYPVLLGASRKSVIGMTLDLPTEERLEGTLATTVLAVQQQCAFVRVHDVRENVRAIRMAEAVLYTGGDV